MNLPVEQIDDWINAHNGLVGHATLPVAWRPNGPQEQFVQRVRDAWVAPKPVQVVSPEGNAIPCHASVFGDTTRCEVRVFCDFWDAELRWVGNKLTVKTSGQTKDITNTVCIEGDTARANLRDLATVLSLGIGDWQEREYDATAVLKYM
jgi:hypothetical protein